MKKFSFLESCVDSLVAFSLMVFCILVGAALKNPGSIAAELASWVLFVALGCAITKHTVLLICAWKNMDKQNNMDGSKISGNVVICVIFGVLTLVLSGGTIFLSQPWQFKPEVNVLMFGFITLLWYLLYKLGARELLRHMRK